MVLMVLFSSRISPRTSTVILRERSPLATAVVTSAMLRTCAVRLPAMELTESVKSFHTPPTPLTSRLTAQFALASDFAGHARDFAGEGAELIHHGVDGVLQLQNFAAHVHRDFARKVAVGDGRSDLRDVADLSRQVAGHEIDRIRQIVPHAADAFHHRLPAQLSVRTHFARHARNFAGEGAELIHHGVDRVLQFQNFAQHVHRDFARQIAARHSRGHFRDIANLRRKVRGHRVNRIRQILPRSRHTCHHRLSAELAFRTHFTRHARHLAANELN